MRGAPAPTEQAGAVDSLTGLLDRSGFARAYRAAIVARVPPAPMSLAVVDVDGLDELLARHGPEIADRAIVRLGEVLARFCPREGLARWSGGEFAILFAGSDSERARFLIAQGLSDLGREGLRLAGGAEVQITFSAGVSDVEGHPTVQEAMASADRFLNRAKTLGGNHVLGGRPTGVFFLETG